MKTGTKIIAGLIVAIVLIAVAAFMIIGYYNRQLESSNGSSTEIVTFTIEQGSDIKTIATKLETEGIIQNADIFYWYVKFESLGPSIQAGDFRIPLNLTIPEVVATLQQAGGDDMWVSFQEGIRLDEIAGELQAQFLLEEGSMFNKEEFLAIAENPDDYALDDNSLIRFKPNGVSLEGFLYPDTYNIRKDIPTIDLIQLFIDTFEEKLGEDVIAKLDISEEGFYGSLILASIVEREGKNEEERGMIAYILLTRLHEGVEDGTKLLQTDATLLYLQKDWVTPVTQALKEEDNLYNTYLYPGLPPTPISNPGIETMTAVAQPTENSYLYYLHGNDGSIHYGETFAEHENNQFCYIIENTDFCNR